MALRLFCFYNINWNAVFHHNVIDEVHNSRAHESVDFVVSVVDVDERHD